MKRRILAATTEITNRSEFFAMFVLAALSGCSGQAPGTPGPSGGAVTAGGAAASGGSGALVGATGGAGVSNGGSVAFGGSNSFGGSSAGGTISGGAPTMSSGGASSGGATSGGGGTTSSGGALATGGTVSSGGANTGGVTASGGAIGLGGSSAGGAKASGGTASGGSGNGGTAGAGGGTLGGVVGQPIGFATLNGGTTGGKAGQVVTATTFAELKQYAAANQPYVILVSGTISNGAAGGKINVTSNKSLVGIGSTAFLQGVGLEVANSNNVIIQNLKITLVGTTTPASVNGGDAIVINGTSKNVWIDHCELYSEDPTVQTDVDKYDGLLDIRDQTGFITVSWNYFHDHHKTTLVGASDTDLHDDRKITYHHNYFRKVIKRAPEYRGAVGHFFNNYVIGTSKTEASFLLANTCLRIEKNVYETVNFAIYTVATGTKGNAERIDNIGSQSREWPPACTATIPYDYQSALTTTTSDVKTVVPAGAGVGKL